MTPYYIMLALPALLTLVAHTKGQKLLNPTARRSAPIIAFFVILGILLACRDITCGIDLTNYTDLFSATGRLSWKELFERHGNEFLYFALNKVVFAFSSDFQSFLLVTAAITVLPLMHFYKENAVMPFLTILLFVVVAPFSMLFSGLRQVIAMMFVVPAWHCVKRKKLFLFIITVLLAIGFHNSALIIIAMYPLYHLKITKKWLLFIVPAMVGIYIFNEPIFLLLAELWGGDYYESYGTTHNTGAYAMLVLFILLAVISYVLPDNEKLDNDTLAMRNYLLLVVFLQIFTPINGMIMRMNYYYLLFVPALIPKILASSKKRFYQVGQLAVLVMSVFFLFYFIVNMYTGEDILQVYPYVAFWEGIN